MSRFTKIVLERESEEYEFYRVEDDPAQPTLLHLAAEKNFLQVVKVLVERYPLLVNVGTEQVGDERDYLPVEKALMSLKTKQQPILFRR